MIHDHILNKFGVVNLRATKSRTPFLLQITVGATLACITHGANAQTAFQQAADGTVSMEMENFDQNVEGAGASWTLVSDADASSAMAMQAPGTGQPRLEYRVNFTRAGTHFVFVRAQGNSGGSNSMWLGFNGEFFLYNANINPLNSWQWEGGFAIDVPAVGEYTVTMVRRESDALGDKIVIKTSNVVPTGNGPVQSPRDGGGNNIPVVQIASPADGANFALGGLIDFSGTANDNEEGELSASLLWASDQDGPIGSGANFSTSLSAGTHIITASAEDSSFQIGSTAVTVTIDAPTNAAPIVTITSPADGSSFSDVETISFAGTASDTESGDVTASLRWISNIDGVIGSGSSFESSGLS
ncbi:MAG: hypothetical protein HQ492_02400, partial [Woeseiaceae bacterium]|nr:hypothetical protein [Woeseiaceae bacterium]